MGPAQVYPDTHDRMPRQDPRRNSNVAESRTPEHVPKEPRESPSLQGRR